MVIQGDRQTVDCWVQAAGIDHMCVDRQPFLLMTGGLLQQEGEILISPSKFSIVVKDISLFQNLLFARKIYTA